MKQGVRCTLPAQLVYTFLCGQLAWHHQQAMPQQCQNNATTMAQRSRNHVATMPQRCRNNVATLLQQCRNNVATMSQQCRNTPNVYNYHGFVYTLSRSLLKQCRNNVATMTQQCQIKVTTIVTGLSGSSWRKAVVSKMLYF